MINPVFIWCVTAAIILLLVIVNIVRHFSSHTSTRRQPIIGMSDEREIFYVPGDRLVDDDFYE